MGYEELGTHDESLPNGWKESRDEYGGEYGIPGYKSIDGLVFRQIKPTEEYRPCPSEATVTARKGLCMYPTGAICKRKAEYHTTVEGARLDWCEFHNSSIEIDPKNIQIDPKNIQPGRWLLKYPVNDEKTGKHELRWFRLNFSTVADTRRRLAEAESRGTAGH